MQSEGPYTHTCFSKWNFLCPACIYSEGRKSMEKDFKELLEIANNMENMLKEIWSVYANAPGFQMKYDDWKKARGIE